MKYIHSTILRDETIIHYTRPHWIVFMPGVLAVIIAWLFLQFGPDYYPIKIPLWHHLALYQLGGLACFVIGVLWLIKGAVEYYTTEYGITDKRLIMKRGFIMRDTLELFLQRIETITVSQSVIGRFVNYGTLFVIGTGGTRNYYLNVPAPLFFRKLVQQETERVIDASNFSQGK